MREKMEELIEKLVEIQDAFLRLARETGGPEPNGITWPAFQIAETCGKAAEELQRNIPRKNEVEGGGPTWWYVCPECHGTIDRQDHYCKHCGQAVKWK